MGLVVPSGFSEKRGKKKGRRIFRNQGDRSFLLLRKKGKQRENRSDVDITYSTTFEEMNAEPVMGVKPPVRRKYDAMTKILKEVRSIPRKQSISYNWDVTVRVTAQERKMRQKEQKDRACGPHIMKPLRTKKHVLTDNKWNFKLISHTVHFNICRSPLSMNFQRPGPCKFEHFSLKCWQVS